MDVELLLRSASVDRVVVFDSTPELAMSLAIGEHDQYCTGQGSKCLIKTVVAVKSNSHCVSMGKIDVVFVEARPRKCNPAKAKAI